MLAVIFLGLSQFRGIAAQTPPTCRPVLDSAGVGRRIVRGPGRIHQYGSGGVLIRCAGQSTTVSSDSMAWYSDLDRLDFVGSVRFQDDTVTLTARRARYFPSDERIEAYDNVRLVNRLTRSVLSGPDLIYRRTAPGVRDTSELVATRRPRIEYRSTADSGVSAYVIVGEHVRLKGDGLAWAGGDVTIEREDFVARADSATLDLEAEEGLLIGKAVAEARDTGGYAISGTRIAYRLAAERLTWIQAQGEARGTSAEWRVEGDTIEFDVADDLIQSGQVWGDSTRSVAVSQYYSVEADSLALDAPDQQLEEVRGFRDAHATRRDSLADVTDWMSGDTVVARFGGSESGELTLTMLEARGNARAFYHLFEADDRSAAPAINYARGARIIARFKDDGLDRVDVVDAADGIYLEPETRRRP
jgi:hypothetical protein